MDFTDVYSLGTAFLPASLHVRPAHRSIDAVGLLRGDLAPNTPVAVEVAAGRIPRDLVSATRTGIHLLSPRTQQVLREGGFMGWKTYPIRVNARRSSLLDGYVGLVVTGRSGAIDDSRSERVILPPKTPQGQAIPAWRGLYFDPSSWDGNEFFVPSGTAHIIVGDAVRRAIEAAGLSNFRFTPLAEFERLVI